MPICQLCHSDRKLRNSHIVPEFLYDDLYNDKNYMMAINGQGNRGWKPLQKGIRQHLFCESCEQYFNEHFEKPFHAQWVLSKPLPNPFSRNEVFWVTVDYASFKLFHLSVLFRAGVSSLPTFAEVTLGPHQERLRQLILNRDPGDVAQYPVFGYAVVHHKTNELIPIVSHAQRSSFGGHRCYGMMYGGVEWWISVSSHRNLEFETGALQLDGRMPFHAVQWNEVSVIQTASRTLRSVNR